MKLLLGWLGYSAVMLLPWTMPDNRIWMWALSWAGWYAHRDVSSNASLTGGSATTENHDE